MENRKTSRSLAVIEITDVHHLDPIRCTWIMVNFIQQGHRELNQKRHPEQQDKSGEEREE
jgi:hypothetical protein